MPSPNISIISQNPDSEYIQNLMDGLRARGLMPTLQSCKEALAAPAGPPAPGILDLRLLDDQSFDAAMGLIQRTGSLWMALTDVDAKRLNPARRRLVFERAWVAIEPSDSIDLVCELAFVARRHLAMSGRASAPSAAVFGEMVGGSPVMLKLYDKLKRFALADAPVLILGETGTGKELIASSLHEGSPRKRKPFVALNCAAIPAELIGSELFGHEQGAFTDASTTRIGRLEQAQGGTLFLDEIGDLPLEAQTYLLRALQEGVIERLGSTEPIAIDVRIIAATHVDLARAVEEGRFRLDLLHRLKVLEVTVPRLRDRGDDVRVLADHFLERFRTDTRRVIRGFSAEAMDAVLMHQWPGNVREMSNRIRQACVLGEGRWISATDLGLRAAQASSNQTLDEIREQAEVRAIREALLANERGMARAAESLGVSRMTLYRLIQKHQAHLLDVIGDVGASEKAVPSKGSQVQLVA
jgi:DNA-binding NtrC family response regulator